MNTNKSIKSEIIKKYFKIVFILIIIFFIDYIVYLTGGTQSAFTHLMYIPIIISAFYFDITGALAAAVLGGIALKIVPLNVADGTVQVSYSWLFRTVMFIIVGAVTALLFRRVKTFKKAEIERFYQNVVTGLPNVNRLKNDINGLINKHIDFSLIAFKVVNIDEINGYLGYDIGKKSMLRAAEILKNQSCIRNVYAEYTNEFAVILPNCSLKDARLKGLKSMNILKEPIIIDGFSIELIIKVGVVNYPLHSQDANDLIQKIYIVLDHVPGEDGISIYNTSIEQKSRERFEIITSLINAINNNEFHIVYQPKISIETNSVIGLEALIRWNNRIIGQKSPEEFIKIAEDIGFINEITKWVIKNTIDQIKIWQTEGLFIKVAFNISSKDLNNSMVEYMKNCIIDSEIEPIMLEIELTERSIVKNEKMAKYLLYSIKDLGIQISLDDFGTGYNSLIGFINLPIDNIKIDKLFIDNINDHDSSKLIETIISFAHNTGKKVVAEGVENEKQLEVLKSMGCDYIQGYYFSKPVPPEEIKKFILSFPNDPA
ncbi:MAG: putative bifunctional diguanylate cyclase/phosphodiesterase [Oscillospiraceae bacterium]